MRKYLLLAMLLAGCHENEDTILVDVYDTVEKCTMDWVDTCTKNITKEHFVVYVSPVYKLNYRGIFHNGNMVIPKTNNGITQFNHGQFQVSNWVLDYEDLEPIELVKQQILPFNPVQLTDKDMVVDVYDTIENCYIDWPLDNQCAISKKDNNIYSMPYYKGYRSVFGPESGMDIASNQPTRKYTDVKDALEYQPSHETKLIESTPNRFAEFNRAKTLLNEYKPRYRVR